MAGQRQVDGVVQPGRVRSGRLRGPETLEELTRCPTRSSPTGHPWCAGIGPAWPPGGRSPTGRGLHAAASTGLRSTTSGSTTRSRSTIRRSWPSPTPSAVPQEPRVHGRREQRHGDRHDEVPGRRVPITTGDCYMHRQASFYSGLFPEGTVVGRPRPSSGCHVLLPARRRSRRPEGDARRRRPPRCRYRAARDVGRHPVRHSTSTRWRWATRSPRSYRGTTSTRR